MGLKKGMTNNPNGKPKGARSEKSKQWDLLGESIVNQHADRFNKVLATLEDTDFVSAYTKILSYFKPQLARTEIKDTTEVKKPLEIVVKDEKSKKNLDKLVNGSN